MRIIHFLLGRCNPDTANGVEKTVYNLAVHQAAMGHEVSLLCISSKAPIPIPSVKVVNIRRTRIPGIVNSAVFEHLRKEQPDIVHLHSVYIPENARVAFFLKNEKIPYVITPHGGCARKLLNRRAWLKRPYRRLIELPCLNAARFVHSVGDTDHIRAYGVTAPVVEVPNGIDRSGVPQWSGGNFVLQQRPDWVGKTLHVFVGRLDPLQKGLDLLFHGLAAASKRGANLGVVLVGPDWEGHRKNLEVLARKLGITDSVLFTGPVYGSQKFDAIYSGDFFIHTSRWEGMSFSTIEALACGKPCLLTKAADPGGIVARHRCGIIVGEDIDAIADGLIASTTVTDAEKDAMSQAALEVVTTQLDWKQIAKKLTASYTTDFCA